MSLFNRRAFFSHLAGLAGVVRAESAETPARAKNVIFVFLAGGISQVDTFDLKEGSWTPKPFDPTPYNGVRFPRGIMPQLADRMSSLVLLRSVRSWAAEHALATNWLQIGRNPTRPDALASPHIGAVVSMELAGQMAGSKLPVFMSLNSVAGQHPNNGFLPSTEAPFLVGQVSGDGVDTIQHPDGRARWDSRARLLSQLRDAGPRQQQVGPVFDELRNFQDRAQSLVYDTQVNKAFTLTAEEKARYGNTYFGNACMVARNLLRYKLGPRFIEITYGDWDHHGQIYASSKISADNGSLIRGLDAGLAQMISDLKQDGLLDETLIVAMSEFGRTPGPATTVSGRDHHTQQAVLVTGAKVKGGRAIGSTNTEGTVTKESGWRFDRDIHHEDLEATIYSALGIDWTKEMVNPVTGGRFQYVPGSDTGEYAPVTEIWG